VLDNSFPEVNHYVDKIVDLYQLNIIKLGNFSEGLQYIKKNYPNIKSIFMGTRREDPHGAHLNVFHPTDPGWPEFVRISPVLDWDYHDIWSFILYFKLPYCTMYDDGYTSIGQTHNTIQNPALAYVDIDGKEKFYPAYSLKDGTKERDGRIGKSKC